MAILETPILKQLGASLREARRARGLTVKELAEASELSERFVISVEGGRGNLSVLSLVAMARALGAPVSRFVDDAWTVQKQKLSRPLALTGLRGAGKSTIGAAAAERLGVPFIELDERISARAGMPVGEIFEVHGGTHVRKLEREAWEDVLRGPPVVVATAGGIVTDAGTYERVLATADVVWLRASPEDHLGRVQDQGDTRPMANRTNAMRELRAILRARGALYERAHHVVDTSKLGLERSVERLVRIAG